MGLAIRQRIKRQVMQQTFRYYQTSSEYKIKQQAPKLWQLIQEYLAKSKSSGCDWTDYWALYSHVKQYHPREILECGTGVSTLVLAFAAYENSTKKNILTHVTSMEEIPFYHEQSVRFLPEFLKPYVDILLSPRIEDAYCIYRGVRYRDTPNKRYEFAFIDGPNTRSLADDSETFDFDLVHVIKQADYPVYALIDMRLTTCYVLQKILGRDLVRYDWKTTLGYVGPCSKYDLKTISQQSSRALQGSIRLLGETQFHLNMEQI